MMSLDVFYILVGLLFAATAVMTVRDTTNPRRMTTALFWGLYALVYLLGERLPPAVAGVLMIVMALVAGAGLVRPGRATVAPEAERQASAARLGNRLLVPALAIPAVTMLGSVALKDVHLGARLLLDPNNVTLVSMGCGSVAALALACGLTRATPLQGVREARRLIDAMSWAVVLPHMLAVLGLLFAEAGVGKAVARVATTYLPLDSRLLACAAFCVGMALFTVVMGNGFAAFPRHRGRYRDSRAGRRLPCESRRDGGDRHVQRLLRYPDDADGCEFQRRAGAAARPARQECRDQGPAADRAAAAGREYRPAVLFDVSMRRP
jgi:uncharacterized membrane protein